MMFQENGEMWYGMLVEMWAAEYTQEALQLNDLLYDVLFDWDYGILYSRLKNMSLAIEVHDDSLSATIQEFLILMRQTWHTIHVFIEGSDRSQICLSLTNPEVIQPGDIIEIGWLGEKIKERTHLLRITERIYQNQFRASIPA